MNVGIDITPVLFGRGVSRYTANLTLALAKHRLADVSLYGSSWSKYGELEQFASQVKSVSHSKIATHFDHYPPKVQRVLWNHLHQAPVWPKLPKMQVFHSWDWIQPPDEKLPLVSTIHDLAILRYPDIAHPEVMDMQRRSWETLKARGSEIIAVSHSTKRDIVELLGISPQKISVIYEALPMETVAVAEAMEEDEEEQIATSLRLSEPYIFFVGSREPRKNLLRLIEAWLPLSNEFQLIIAGEIRWDSSEKVIEKLTLKQKNQLRFLGRVSDQQLAVLYERAELLAYPCVYEGFGLPILEAFYHGIPVVTSDVSGMQEVAGNAAELVDPMSVESIRKGISKVAGENREEQQRRLQKMIIRLQQFDWHRVAQETAKVYGRAIAAHQ